MWKARKGSTLLVPSGPSHDPDRMHLHVVLTDPMAATGQVLLASVCKIPASNLYDSSCTLFPQEHEFITRHSYVDYGHCKIAAVTFLHAKIASGEFVAKAPLDAKRIEDVLIGFAETNRVAPKYRRFFESAG